MIQNSSIQSVFSQIKPYLKGLIIIGVVFFLGKTVYDNWSEIVSIRLDNQGWSYLAIAVCFTLVSYSFAGWIWSWILHEFNQSVNPVYLIRVYLRTNLAKYLPGNVWHYYGRITGLKSENVPLSKATLSVLIEPIFIAAAALLVAAVGNQISEIFWEHTLIDYWQILLLVVALSILHPAFLNPLLRLVGKLNVVSEETDAVKPEAFIIKRYPLIPLFGAFCVVALRCVGFLFVLMAFNAVSLHQFPIIINAFVLGWIASLFIPGVPGGIGIFEATAIAYLSNSFSTGIVISAVALYRVISIVAELLGVGLAAMGEKQNMES